MHPDTLERGGKRVNIDSDSDTAIKKIKVGFEGNQLQHLIII